MKTALVTGGAGYLGSHLAKALKKAGYLTICFDEVQTKNEYYDLQHIGDIRNYGMLNQVFANFDIDIVFHLAGRIEVGESIKHPELFCRFNRTYFISLFNNRSRNSSCKFFFAIFL